MGRADTATTNFMRQNDVFADAFNFFLYQGCPVIDPGQLRELDPAELAMPYGADKKSEPVQKYRDILKGLAAMEDGKRAYLLLGIEGQTRVHYAAPVKGMLYDSLQYARQVEQTGRKHREKKEYGRSGSGEFLAGFYKKDKLIPVITLFISFSPEKWDGPRSLWEMMEMEDTKLRTRLPDYRINLVSPAELGKEEFEKFHSSLGDVLEFIKYSSDKEKLMEWLSEEKRELTLGRKEVEVLNACVNAKLAIKSEEEEVEVCKAIEDYKREAVEKNTKEVTEKVTKQVTETVTKQVTESTRLSDLRSLMKNMQLTAQQAAAALGFSPEDTVRLLEKL